MTREPSAAHGQAAPTRHPVPDVVAGLVNDGQALAVAQVAVAEAQRRSAQVRFVHVLPSATTAEDRADADRATFRAAMRALAGHSRVACAFETAIGDPGRVLVQRSGGASLLVLGGDLPAEGRSVARYCQHHATCSVLVVPYEA
jgi:nucleotide-binding universal stress UspA family protein